MTPTKTKRLNDTCVVELQVDEMAPPPNERVDSIARLYCWHPGYRFNDHAYADRSALADALGSAPDLRAALARDLFMVPPPPSDYHIALRMGQRGPDEPDLTCGEQLVGTVVVFRQDLEQEGLDPDDYEAVEAIATEEVDLWRRYCNAQVYCLLFKTWGDNAEWLERDLRSVGSIYDISDENLDSELLEFLPVSLHDDIRRTHWEART